MAKIGKNKTKENNHEMFFRWYCEELMEYGFIESFSREAETFTILPNQEHKRVVHFVQKENGIENFNILSEINYTYDFRLIWTKKAEYLFYEIYYPNEPFIFGRPQFIAHELNVNNETKIVSYVDVKPHSVASKFSGSLASAFTFPFVQKITFYLYKLYINKVVPVHSGKHGHKTCLFAETFVPNRYLFTDKSGELRKIPYKTRSITSFVNNREQYVNKYLNKAKAQQQKLL